jgi:anti-sigma28 factor (negative regulator of flagellin synthesis)
MWERESMREAGAMRQSSEGMDQRVGRDRRNGSASAGMRSSHKSDGKLERVSLARTRAEDVEKARLAESLIARSAADSDVRLELVERLREEVAAGTYRVAAKDVAAKMVGARVR